jgi:hypothetical protein
MHASRFRPAALVPSIVATLTATLACSLACAGPLVLEYKVTLVPPIEKYDTADAVAIDNDHAIVVSKRHRESSGSASDDWEVSAFLFERNSGGTWLPIATLLVDEPASTFDGLPISAAIQTDVAAIAWLDTLFIFKWNGTAWPRVATLHPTFPLDTGGDVAINRGQVVLSVHENTRNKAIVYGTNAVGQWVEQVRLDGGPNNTFEEYGDDVDYGGNVAVLANPASDFNIGQQQSAYVYGRVENTWSPSAILTSPIAGTGYFAYHVATDNQSILVSDGVRNGVHLFRNTGGAWPFEKTLRPVDALGSTKVNGGGLMLNRVAVSYSYLAAVGDPVDDTRGDGAGAVLIYPLEPGTASADPVAKIVSSVPRSLQPPGSPPIGRLVAISGRRVIASAPNGALLYELPNTMTQPSRVQDDFELGNAAEWTPSAGSSFTVTRGRSVSQVYRQSSLAGDALSIRGGTDWTNQAIQAEITPTSFDGTDRWFGLVARYSDASNYYYVTVRNSNVVQLKRMQNGSFTTLASQALPVTTFGNYDVRLEAIGSVLRVFVNGALVADVKDSVHAHGSAGIAMYKAAADYDNVIITPNPRSVLFADSFTSGVDEAWTPTSGTWGANSASVYAQTSTTGDARSHVGIPTEDQTVTARARATAFATGTGEWWFGLAARYVDDGNYYYLTLRKSGELSLRKLTNGTITVLDSFPITVPAGDWFDVKLEVIGDKLRGYVNGQIMVEATDSTLPSGRYGAVMYKTAAEYDNFLVTQP